MKLDVLPQYVERVILTMCEDLDTPVSLGVAIRCKHRCWDDLASMKVVPEHYNDSEKFWADSACVAFLRKCQDLPTTIDRKAVAVENFWISERQCFRTNQRLTHLLRMGSSYSPEERRLVSFLELVKTKMRWILGYPPQLEELQGKFGSGATYVDKGQHILVPDKISSRPHLTHDSWPVLFPWTGTAWAHACALESRDPVFVRGNRFTTVPKDCTKDRGIAVEPSVNVFYQLALGRLMKMRLQKRGIDLKEGQSEHREMARRASVDGSFMTLDLSNASDTVSKVLVKTLLPHGWYEVLETLRSPCTLIDDHWVLLEKFSSMGNGFTFELETAIFLSIALAVGEEMGETLLPGVDVFVYGDDIIVPVNLARPLIGALKFLGFTPNERKTFSTGWFRESCGGDFWGGVDVRPFFLKEFPREPQDFITIANGLYRMAAGDCYRPHRARLLSNAWVRVLDCIPSHIRCCYGPQGLGDIVIHAPKERWKFRWRHGIRYVRSYAPAERRSVEWHHWTPENVLATALYTAGNVVSQRPFSPVGSPSGDAVGITPRDAVTGYKCKWVPYS